MMKKIGLLFLSLIIFIGQIPVYAAEIPALEYKISSNGASGDTPRYAQPGETITVQFSINRTDGIGDNYTVYGMQNYIVYDADFFELVENSCKTVDVGGIGVKVLTEFGGITTIQITQINYPTYKSDFVAAEFKLRVKDNAVGSGMVTSQENQAFCSLTGSVNKIVPEITNLTVKIADPNEFDVEVYTGYVEGYHLVEVTGNYAGYLFDGNPMIAVEHYDNKRVYLTNILTSTDYDALIEEAKAYINPSDTFSDAISSGYNVNVDSVNDDNVDIYDASAVFAAQRNELSVDDNMTMFLRADVNGNHQVNEDDLDDIVAIILSQ